MRNAMTLSQGMEKNQVSLLKSFFEYAVRRYIDLSSFGAVASHYKHLQAVRKQKQNNRSHPWYCRHNDREPHTIGP